MVEEPDFEIVRSLACGVVDGSEVFLERIMSDKRR